MPEKHSVKRQAWAGDQDRYCIYHWAPISGGGSKGSLRFLLFRPSLWECRGNPSEVSNQVGLGSQQSDLAPGTHAVDAHGCPTDSLR